MTRHHLLGLSALSALSAVASTVVFAAGGSAQQSAGQTLALVERPGTGHVVDNPPAASRDAGSRSGPRFSMGDLTVQTAPIYDASNARRLGTLHVQCIATRGGTRARAAFNCTGAYQLASGMMALAYAGPSAERVTFAVTGGTGAFEGRTGSVVSAEDGTVTRHAVHLVP